MSAIDFPASPTTGQNFTAGNGVTYQWNGTFWIVLSASQPVAQRVGFFAVHNGVFGLPVGGAQVTLAFDTVVTGNEGNWYSPTTGRFTPPAGRYHLWATFTGFLASGATLISTVLRKNGVNIIAAQQVPANTNWGGDPAVVATLDLNGTDYIDIAAGANNGASGIAKHCFFGADTVELQAPYIPAVYYGAFEAGDVKAVAHNATPTGWYECDGSLKSRVTDASLFAAIGTTWGAGDGSTTFALPDFRGRVLAHIDGGAGRLGSGSTGGITTGATLGATGGQQAHAQVVGELAVHTHAYLVGGVPANGINVRGTSGDGTNPGYPNTEGASGAYGYAMNVTQPTAVVRYLIKR